MIDLIVIRDPGDKPGPDITDAFLTSADAALERGRIEIDKASDLQPMTIRCVYVSNIMLGDIVEVHDALQGRSWRGKVTSINYTAELGAVFTELEIIRPNEYIL